MTEPLALAGIRVLDLTELLPGPFATQMLADMGADIIKIERPGVGDSARNMLPGTFRMVNRGKRSVELDLKSPDGREALLRLVKQADILVEGYRPGVMKRLGADYATLKAIAPGLIYASISGFGQTGPLRDIPGHDLNYNAVAGVLALCGSADGPPEQAVGVPVADLSGSLYTVTSILAALMLRQKTGQGQYLDVSITDAVFTMVGPRLGSVQDTPGYGKKDVLCRTGYGIYETRDARHIAIGAIEDHFWARLVKVLDIPLLQEARFAKSAQRWKAVDDLEPLIRARIREHSHDEWIEILNRNDVPVTTVTTLATVFEDPQLVERGMILQGDGMRYVNYPVPMEGVDAARHGAPHSLGQDNAAILGAAGFTPEQIAALSKVSAA
ncbi:CaiB/BaiF CoA transferase family protein [Piscinibacter sakaiensis]|uniref:CaiB/BaiF CoA transferase family protein n=1 Tax=Piscinibacter sakaiensis TaxID=1547922 RepID=UPI003AAF43B3